MKRVFRESDTTSRFHENTPDDIQSVTLVPYGKKTVACAAQQELVRLIRQHSLCRSAEQSFVGVLECVHTNIRR